MSNSKAVKWGAIGLVALLLSYVGYVIYFETRLGYLQPQGGNTLVIATFNDENERHERVLSLRQIEGSSYIAVNHWPRAWYFQLLDNVRVEVKMPGQEDFAPYVAVPLEGAELDRVSDIYSVSLNFRFRTGFPPRRFLRLDPA